MTMQRLDPLRRAREFTSPPEERTPNPPPAPPLDPAEQAALKARFVAQEAGSGWPSALSDLDGATCEALPDGKVLCGWVDPRAGRYPHDPQSRPR